MEGEGKDIEGSSVDGIDFQQLSPIHNEMQPQTLVITKSDGAVDHLLHAIGVIFGNTSKSAQSNNIQCTLVNGSSTLSDASKVVNELHEKEISQNNHVTSTGLHECKHCKELFFKKAHLKEHMFNHTGPLKYKCDVKECCWSFHTKYKLERHKMGHTGNKKFLCQVESCGRSFTEACSLKVHMAQCHSVIFKCQVQDCDAQFSNVKKLENHMKKTHVVKQHKCKEENCHMEFDSAADLTHHALTHGKHKCTFEDCGKIFSKKSALELHIRSHTNNRPFKCSFEGCNSAFTSGSKLNRHMKKHSEIRPFCCTFDDCDASFKRQDHLRKHYATHEKQKPFTCPKEGCLSRFTALQSLKTHLTSHTKENRYTCPIEGCTKTYYCKTTLQTHVRRHKTKIEEANSMVTEAMLEACRQFSLPKSCVTASTSSDLETANNTSTTTATELTDISVKEVLIPAKNDLNTSVKESSINMNAQYATVALGEAACFQYINENEAGNTSRPSQITTNRPSVLSDHEIAATHVKNNGMEKSSKMTEAFYKTSVIETPGCNSPLMFATISTGGSVRLEPSEIVVPVPIQAANSTNMERTKLDLSNSIFGDETITVPPSMTRFLPQELQVAEYLSSEYRNDHAYNRTLLQPHSGGLVTSENRRIDTAIENALEVSDSMLEVRSLLAESGMASFLANDDIGRMETCASEGDLTINRKFDRSVSNELKSALMLEKCATDGQSTLDPSYNPYSSTDSYVVSLMETSHNVSEHLLNISNNPTMVDHMYSQHGPEDDDLQIATEDHVYEESTVNLQDIR